MPSDKLLVEWPYLATPEDKGYDIEAEKFQGADKEGAFKNKLTAIFSGKPHEDKYGGKVHLKTQADRDSFRKELASDTYLPLHTKKNFGKEWSHYDAHIASVKPVNEGAEPEGGKQIDTMPDLKVKIPLGTYDGQKVYLVSGAEVRKHFTEFATGGNGEAYPFMKGEIWVERLLDGDDTAFVLAHELIEYTRMKYGKQAYDLAHAGANDAEACLRAAACTYLPDDTPGVADQTNEGVDHATTKKMRDADDAMWAQALAAFKEGYTPAQIRESVESLDESASEKSIRHHDPDGVFGQSLKRMGYSSDEAEKIHAAAHAQLVGKHLKLRPNINPKRMSLIAHHYLNAHAASAASGDAMDFFHKGHTFHEIHKGPDGQKMSADEVIKHIASKHAGHHITDLTSVDLRHGLARSENTLVAAGKIGPRTGTAKGGRTPSPEAAKALANREAPAAPEKPATAPPAAPVKKGYGNYPAPKMSPANAAVAAQKQAARDAAKADQEYKVKRAAQLSAEMSAHVAKAKAARAAASAPAKPKPGALASILSKIKAHFGMSEGAEVGSPFLGTDNRAPGSGTIGAILPTPDEETEKIAPNDQAKKIRAIMDKRKQMTGSVSVAVHSANIASQNDPPEVSTASPGAALQMPPDLR